MSQGSFVTVINCIDGRVQEPVIAWMKREFQAEYVDDITEPGPILILSENTDPATVASIRRRVDISANRHGSHTVAIVAHHDCAGNPVGKSEQLAQLAAAIERVKSWGLPIDVLGLWVNENWKVHPVVFD